MVYQNVSEGVSEGTVEARIDFRKLVSSWSSQTDPGRELGERIGCWENSRARQGHIFHSCGVIKDFFVVCCEREERNSTTHGHERHAINASLFFILSFLFCFLLVQEN